MRFDIAAPEARWPCDMAKAASWNNIAYCLAAAQRADSKARGHNRRFNACVADEYRRTALSLAGGDPDLRREIERRLSQAMAQKSSGPLDLLTSVALVRLRMLLWTGPAAFIAGFIIELARSFVTGRISAN